MEYLLALITVLGQCAVNNFAWDRVQKAEIWYKGDGEYRVRLYTRSGANYILDLPTSHVDTLIRS